MKLILDTHLLLWAAGQSHKLSDVALKMINDPDNELFFSSASLWEITIKNGLGREDLHVNPHLLRRSLLDNDYHELPITSEHAVGTDSLPPIHKDPFDRIIIAQAIAEGFELLTADAIVAQYPGPIKKV
ncbi:MAG: type II toxin-antitoxin system VapC family toxin [Gammaproteobacteria bacterium]